MKAYEALIVDVAKLMGNSDSARVEEDAREIVRFERQLAELSEWSLHNEYR